MILTTFCCQVQTEIWSAAFIDIETHTGKDAPAKIVYQFSDWIDTYKDFELNEAYFDKKSNSFSSICFRILFTYALTTTLLFFKNSFT